MQAESQKPPKIVIVGGGFGGMEMAKKLHGKPVQVLLLDRHNYHTFQPLLYQVATGGLEPDSIAFPLRKMFKDQENLRFRIADVSKVDPVTKTLDTSIGTVSYDFLVLATGSTTNFFNQKNIEANSMPMKTIPEALNLRSLILQNFEDAILDKNKTRQDAFMTFVIVGGGPTGTELAGALAELKNHVLPKDYPELDVSHMKIYLIESSKILATMSSYASASAEKFLKKMGVTVLLNKRVTSYDGDTVVINDGQMLQAENVIWTAGVKGDLVAGMDNKSIYKGNRLLVDRYNAVVGYDSIFAIGDIAALIDDQHPEGYPGVAQVAIQQGKQLADNLLRVVNKKKSIPFSYFDKGSMATIGRNRAVADIGFLHLKGILAWLIWMFVHLLFLVGFRNKLIVVVNWMYNYFSFDRGNRVIIRKYDRKTMTEEAGA